MAEQTQTYFAKSMFSDPTNIASMLSILVGVLALPEVVAIIPLKAMPYILALSGAVAFVLRTWNAVRPVAAIAPGTNTPVEVKKLDVTKTT
jgi:hypothetical protein